ncbi:MAG TPA: DUF3788 family protein [Bacteroidales bacterium]|jgi:hypothetical protein|nr:hypothetical protein [Bacteroidales bacterium]OQC56966.1 MAG: hypothetical protein BWX51_02057 [Bacteroidetes bacterium ADurb.Bin012]MCZ2316052.1 DUF3788 domain-containing protein [Bacteroidales bacterium]NLZ09611.1 DUF3788 family protein [Bacteroidales bacterium]HNR27209.1 DUF3788 family protein [Bacteroidales bacterium]
MQAEIPKQLLRDPEQKPGEALFRSILDQNLCQVMEKILQSLTAAGIDFEWRYYKDGNAWLGKATYRKKTVAWISLWENLVKAGFYFTDKTQPGVLELPLDPVIKTLFAEAKPIGKLIPLTLDIKDTTSLPDFVTLINHKKNLA